MNKEIDNAIDFDVTGVEYWIGTIDNEDCSKHCMNLAQAFRTLKSHIQSQEGKIRELEHELKVDILVKNKYKEKLDKIEEILYINGEVNGEVIGNRYIKIEEIQSILEE
jgi:hypothetical protein